MRPRSHLLMPMAPASSCFSPALPAALLAHAGSGRAAAAGLFAYATAPGLAGTGDSRLLPARRPHPARHRPPAATPMARPTATGRRCTRCCWRAAGSLARHPAAARAPACWAACCCGAGWAASCCRRAGPWLLPLLLALSTPWLLVSKFVWAESVFLLLFAGYAVAAVSVAAHGPLGVVGRADGAGLAAAAAAHAGAVSAGGGGSGAAAGRVAPAWPPRGAGSCCCIWR